MNFLKAGFRGVLGGPGEAAEPSGADTVDRLCDRLASSTLLEDRRDAVRAIKSLSKKFRVDVGTKAMELLTGVLQKDRSDAEICGLALEALCNVLSVDAKNEADDSNIVDADLALQFTEIFLKDAEHVTTLLGLLEEYDFRVRWPTVRLLTTLLENRAMQIQQCVLVSPLGVSRLMDLLSDSREVIRNDGLLLLILLTKGNAAIQKIVAFENAFDRLLEVISEEGYSDGGIVVEDCLSLMSNLFNVSNINFFREGSYIQRLVPFFDFGESSADTRHWLDQKIKNVLLMLKLLRILVSPNNPPQSTQSSQKIMHSCGLLKSLCDILMATGIPVEILTETVNTVAEIIRGNQSNQAYFSTLDAPSTPPKPAIVVLLLSMVNDKQPFPLRCAVLYCFQCYLYKNGSGQARVISTLLPSSAEASNVTAGQLLCAGLFSPDPFSNWCAATALSHSLLGSKELKEQLLRVQLATGAGTKPVSLLQQCSNILCHGGSAVQTKAAILSLLCSWLSGCPAAVSQFLQYEAIIPFLIACVEQPYEAHEAVQQGLSACLIGVCLMYNDNGIPQFTVDAIRRIITTRIDPEHFLTKINEISKTEPYTVAARSTQILQTEPEAILFDHEFTRHFKRIEVGIAKVLLDDDESDHSDKSKALQNGFMNEAVANSYKELIREQDEELSKLRQHCSELEALCNQARLQLQQQAIELVQLRSQADLKSKAPSPTTSFSSDSSAQDFELMKIEVASLNEVVRSQKLEIDSLQKKLESSNDLLNATVEERNVEAVIGMENVLHSQDMQNISNKTMIELDHLRQTVHEREEEIFKLKAELERTVDVSAEVATLKEELRTKAAEFGQQKQDYEDLLVLLEDQDGKIKDFKKRLRALGENVDNESTDEDDGGVDDDDDDDTPDSGIAVVNHVVAYDAPS